MKKIFLIALMAALGFSMTQAQQSFPTKACVKQASSFICSIGQVDKTYAPVQFKADSNDPILEGMARVTLSTGPMWDDTGLQMLLDADAMAYGTVFQAEGPLTDYCDAEDWVYNEFEYKIPENADGSRTTTNVALNNSVSILIPAGVYDYVITNPTPGDCIWIAMAGNIGGRYDNFTFNPDAPDDQKINVNINKLFWKNRDGTCLWSCQAFCFFPVLKCEFHEFITLAQQFYAAFVRSIFVNRI